MFSQKQIDRRAFVLRHVLIGGVFVVGTGYPLARAIQSAREAGYRSTCTCRMKQLTMALMNYHDQHKTFPPAYIADANGKPMHSWRVLLLPFMEERELYARYDFNEPWNGPHNRLLADEMPYVYRCAMEDASSNRPNYVAVVGEETAWPGATAVRVKDIKDGTSKTILLVETVNADFNWLEPRDLTFEEALQGINPPNAKPSISSHYRGGVNCAFGDGGVHFMPNDLAPDVLRGLLTRAGGETAVLPDY